MCFVFFYCCFFQAEDGIRDLVRSRGLGDVYKRQAQGNTQLWGLLGTQKEVAFAADKVVVVVEEVVDLSLIHI